MKILWMRNDHTVMASILLLRLRLPLLRVFCSSAVQCTLHGRALLFWRLESELAVAFNAIDAITLHIWPSLCAMSIGRLQTTDSVCLYTKRLCIKFGCCRIGRAQLGCVKIQFPLISGNHSTVSHGMANQRLCSKKNPESFSEEVMMHWRVHQRGNQ